MRIVIIGPTLLTRKCLEALVRDGRDEIIAVYTLDDVFCNEKSRFVLMDDLTKQNKIELYKIKDINEKFVVDQIKSLKPDVIFELGWSQIISNDILKIPQKGCIGVHASLLPKNRGAASLNWALIRGDNKTGVTLFYLAERPDDGDIIAQKEFDIDDRDDISTLHSKSDIASAELLLENLDDIRNNTVKRKKQDLKEVTYTSRRRPEDGLIDWSASSKQIYNWIRAQTHPFPGAFTIWKKKRFYIWQSAVENSIFTGRPGEIFKIEDKKGIFVVTADGLLLIKRAQLEDGVEMWADDLAKKYLIKPGDFLG